MFGITSDEVKQLCVDYGCPEKFIDIKGLCYSHGFGDIGIYNLWDVLNYISKEFESTSC